MLMLAATLALAPAVQDVSLTVGDAAPALHVETWVKGDAVPAFEKGKVYVVEFWATWCGPCIAGMPHLSELQTAYADKGLTIIGMTSTDSRGNSLEKVKKMVESKGDGMAYTVAWDVDRKTNEAYMKAAGRNGIPCSFLVDQDGKIAYVGHPMWLDLPLEGVLAGTWDYEKGPEQIRKVENEFRSLFGIEDPEEAGKAMDAFAASYPAFAHHVDEARMRLYFRIEDFDNAYAVMGRLVDKAIRQKNSSALNGFAWQIVDPRADLAKKDLELAMRAAKAANELTGEEDPAILDTLARVYFLTGDVEKALNLQRRAVELAPEKMKEGLRGALEEYERETSQAGQ